MKKQPLQEVTDKFDHVPTPEKDSPTPLSAEEILEKHLKKASPFGTATVSNPVVNSSMINAMQEHASQQTAQLRQQVDVLERNILASTDREEKYMKIFTEIANVCGTVNFSSHNQMKEAIQTALELSEQSLNKE